MAAKRLLAEVDVAIAGAGPAGLVLSLLLADSGMKVALVERRARDSRAGTSVRHLALSDRSRAILQRAGVWEELAAQSCPVLDMRIWDARSGGSLDFNHRDVAPEALAWVLPEDKLMDALWQRLDASSAQLHCPGELAGLSWTGNGVELGLEGEKPVRAALAVAADGARSALRQLAGVGCSSRDTGQAVLATLLRTGRPHRQMAVQVFADTGPVGLLPCAGDEHLRCLIWSAPPQQMERLVQSDEGEFLRQLEQVTDGLASDCSDLGERQMARMVHRRAERFSADRVALIGDAARSMHPLAGQGLNLALADAVALADCLAAVPVAGEMFPTALRRFARRRQLEHDLMGTMVDGMLEIFAPDRNDSPAWNWLRGRGMRLADRLPGVRRALAGAASGQAVAPVRPYN